MVDSGRSPAGMRRLPAADAKHRPRLGQCVSNGLGAPDHAASPQVKRRRPQVCAFDVAKRVWISMPACASTEAGTMGRRGDGLGSVATDRLFTMKEPCCQASPTRASKNDDESPMASGRAAARDAGGCGHVAFIAADSVVVGAHGRRSRHSRGRAPLPLQPIRACTPCSWRLFRYSLWTSGAMYGRIGLRGGDHFRPLHR